MSSYTIELWGDFLCPWCWLELRRLRSTMPPAARLIWRSHRLDASLPDHPTATALELMESRYGRKPEQLTASFERIREAGEAHDLSLRTASAFPVNTSTAHRLVQMAQQNGAAAGLLERLFAAYHVENEDISDPQLLSRLSGEAGVDAADAREWMEDPLGLSLLQIDEEVGALTGGISVPTVLVNGVRSGDVSGDAGMRPTAQDYRAICSVVASAESAFNSKSAGALGALLANDAAWLNPFGALRTGSAEITKEHRQLLEGPLRDARAVYRPILTRRSSIRFKSRWTRQAQ